MYIIKEGIELKITKVTVYPTKIFDTYNRSIIVKAVINGFSSEFVFYTVREGNIWFAGIECDTATINGKRIDVTNGGSRTRPTLLISPDVLKSAPKVNQKNFQFTGQEYSTAPIVPVFKKTLQDLFKKGNLTQQFLKAIGY